MGIKSKKYAVVCGSDLLEDLCGSKEAAIKEAKEYSDDNLEEYFVVQIIGSAKTHGKAYYEDI